MTIENIDTSFIEEPVTAMDVAGFRLFLRHNIYGSISAKGGTEIDDIALKITQAIAGGRIATVDGNTITFIVNDQLNTDICTANIIDIVRDHLYTNCSDKILYEINYSSKLTQHEKNAYKKILFEMSRSRMYFDLLLNISYALPFVAIML